MNPYLMLVIAFSVLTVPPPNVAGVETMYVTDVLRLTVRAEPEVSSEVVAVLESGQQMDIIAATGEWTQVRLADDEKGWVRTRYLTPNRSSGYKLDVLKKKYQVLAEQAATLREENTGLKKEIDNMRRELNKNAEALNTVEQSYLSLKDGSADYLQLKTKHKEAAARLSEYSTRIEALENELDKFKTQRIIRWFLTGAGVLFLGLIIGFNAKRQRRRLL